jgi:hypothetical protein
MNKKDMVEQITMNAVGVIWNQAHNGVVSWPQVRLTIHLMECMSLDYFVEIYSEDCLLPKEVAESLNTLWWVANQHCIDL